MVAHTGQVGAPSGLGGQPLGRLSAAMAGMLAPGLGAAAVALSCCICMWYQSSLALASTIFCSSILCVSLASLRT